MSEHGATFFSDDLAYCENLWIFAPTMKKKSFAGGNKLKTASFAYFLVFFYYYSVCKFVCDNNDAAFDEDKYKNISSLHSKTDNLIVSKSRSVHYTNTSGKCIRPFTSEWNLVSYYILRSERAKI